MGNCTSIKDNDLISQGKNSIFEIDSNNELGFFCLIEENFKTLITNFDVSQNINNLNNVEIKLCNNKKKNIEINELRFICYDQNLNYTCIEIFEEDNINNFFKVDFNYKILEDKKMFLFETFERLIVKENKIKLVNDEILISKPDNNFLPPILNEKNKKLIGIFQNNKGILIKKIVDDILEKKKNKDLNYIVCKYEIQKEKLNEEIQIINFDEDNKKEIEEKCIIFINKKKTKLFSFKHKLDKEGENEIIILFKKNLINMKKLFSECIYLQSINFEYFKSNDIINMSELFYKCNSIKNIDFSNFNTKKVKDMSWMFYECKNLKKINLSKFNTENTTDISFMFQGCENLENIDLSNFITKNLVEMKSLFYNCRNLKNVNLSSFNTENVEDISCMFSNCISLVNLDLNHFRTHNVKKINWMFYKCLNLQNLNIKYFNLEKIEEDYKEIFYGLNEKCKINCDNSNIKNMSRD